MAIALVLGGLTALGQQYLPAAFRSVANCAGSWSLIAFLLARRAPSPLRAAACGSLALWVLLAGYVALNTIRGLPSSAATVVFWLIAGLIAGPILGSAALATRTRSGPWSACGAAAIMGVLVGEGIYGLTVIADSTSPVYWCIQIAAGLTVGIVVGWRRRWTWPIGVLAVVVATSVAGAFLLGYSLIGRVG